MASPVDTSVKHIHSNMLNSPVLNGVAGSLVGLLDAFLVDGWGLQTATSLVVSGGIATLTFPSAFPATVDSVILVAGASVAALNGEQKVTQILTATNQVRFATAAPDGAATGTITVKMAPAGWSKVFSGTNKAVYRSLDPQAHGGGYYLRVDDSGSTTARVVGYEQMTDVDTGVGAFPTNTQMSGGGHWAKSSTASAVARGFALIADSRTFYIYPQPYGPGNYSGYLRGFGDGVSLRPAGDAYASFLNASTSSNVNSFSGPLDNASDAFTWTPRPIYGLGTSEAGRAYPYSGSLSGSSGADATFGSFPSSVDGALFLSRKFWATSTSLPPRFDFPGLCHIPQTGVGAAFEHFTSVPGSGPFAGRNFMMFPTGGSLGGVPPGASVVDITGPWR